MFHDQTTAPSSLKLGEDKRGILSGWYMLPLFALRGCWKTIWKLVKYRARSACELQMK